MILTTRFDVFSRVKVIELGVVGRVIAIWFGDNLLMYKVRYFWQGKPEEVYFIDAELQEEL